MKTFDFYFIFVFKRLELKDFIETFYILGFCSLDLHQHSFHRHLHLEFASRSTVWARAFLRRQHSSVHFLGSQIRQVRKISTWGSFHQHSTLIFGLQHRVNGIKVERKFWLCALVQLGVILLIKLNGAFYSKHYVPAHLRVEWMNEWMILFQQLHKKTKLHNVI